MTARFDIEAVAAGVLALHVFTLYPGEIVCDCEWTNRDDVTRQGDSRMIAAHVSHVAAVLAEALAAMVAEVRAEALREALGCHPNDRETTGTPCQGNHPPALWGSDGCTWVAEVAECLGEMGVGG